MLIIKTNIVVIIMLVLFLLQLLVAAYPSAPHASVGSRDGGFPAADRRRRTSAADVVGGCKDDMEKLILWRRKIMAEPGPHKSPSAPHNFPHQRRLLGTSSEHEDRRPPSPATKNSGMGGAGDDDGIMTKMNEEIISSCGGKHNHGEYGVVARRCRRWRRLIAAGTSDSPPSPGYHRH